MSAPVALLEPCMAVALWPGCIEAARQVLRHLGVEERPAPGQTCCGQPAFNLGEWEAARPVAERARGLMGPGPCVSPSASCAAMVRHGWPRLGIGAGAGAWDFADYLWHCLGVRSWPPYPRPLRACYHPACHGRMLGGAGPATALLGLVGNLVVVPLAEPEQCCGFGGAFCATHPGVSGAIGRAKLEAAREAGAEALVSSDPACLAHLEGLERKSGGGLRFAHVAEVLAACL